jgi:hypothetical protein
MKQISIISNTAPTLCSKELKQINGGTFESGYEAGQATGEFVRECLDDWGVIDALYTLFKFLK